MIGRNRAGRVLAAVMVALRGRMIVLWLAAAAVIGFSATGIARLEFDDGLIRFFDSSVPAFEDYAATARAFENDSADLIVLVEADDVAAPAVVAALSDFLLDAQFVPGVRAVISPFSLRVPGPGGVLEPLFPYPPPPRDEMAARLAAELARGPALGRMMADDRSALLVILPITESGADAQEERHAQIEALAALAGRAEAASGARLRLSGYPVLRETVSRALIRDIVLLNLIGLSVGFVVAVATFRSVRVGLINLPGPTVAVALVLGLFGHLGVAINTITVTLPVLVLVLGASDAIHISFERARQGGRNPAHATLRAVRRVAVACLFASLTTALAFAALALSHSEIIAELGRMGVLATLLGTVTVLLIQTLALTAAGHFAWFPRLFGRLHDRPPAGLGLGRLPHLAMRAPRAVAWAALAALAVSTWLYAQAGPRYSLLDSLHDTSPVLQVFDVIEEKVAPVSQILIPVGSTDPAVVARVDAIVARVTGSPYVQSVAMVEGGAAAADARLPEALARRLVSKDGTRTLVTVPFAYVNGDQTMALADALAAALAAEPGLAGVEVGPVTGLPVMSARVAGVILDEINRSLLIALAGVGALIVVWLGNLRVAIVALLPNMLPVTLIGAWLTLSGRGIEFSNGLALTVAFGIAVDDTLHVLNRLRLTGGVARIGRRRLLAALDEVAPALVTTSLVLILGVGGSLLAETKGVTDFGKIAMAVYALALVADLAVLPAALATFRPRARRTARKDPA